MYETGNTIAYVLLQFIMSSLHFWTCWHKLYSDHIFDKATS